MGPFSTQFHLYRWLRIIFLFATGLVIVINPIKSEDAIVYFVSAYLFIYGLIAIADNIKLYKIAKTDSISMLLGIGSIILSVITLFVARFLISLIPILLGIILIVNGINQFRDSNEDRKFVNVTPWLDYLYSVLMIAVGLVLILNPLDIVRLVFWLFGFGLIALSVFELINTRLYK
ncbi:DUF308 domain-containing protein [Lactobacillus sp. YT155]|uniref:DUF308 domain-containing protein n=1 Tax=Lactobacillus sp. YT155 TaxID=3060955 RepID=UPI00265EF35F|nr:DUF308 domain-containing protein [Lactobacillus sp. YT155]MDO1605737.1 DUF308 domain-containing protein [Lactobacillus sp. YT155]